MTYEIDQLEKAVRDNNVRIVKKILDLHCHKLHGQGFWSCRRSSNLDKWSGYDSGSRRISHESPSRKVSQDIQDGTGGADPFLAKHATGTTSCNNMVSVIGGNASVHTGGIGGNSTICDTASSHSVNVLVKNSNLVSTTINAAINCGSDGSTPKRYELRKLSGGSDQYPERRESSATDTDNNTYAVITRNCLHIAIQHSAFEVLKVLLQHGINPNGSGSLPSDESRRLSSISDISIPRERKDVRFQLSSKAKDHGRLSDRGGQDIYGESSNSNALGSTTASVSSKSLGVVSTEACNVIASTQEEGVVSNKETSKIVPSLVTTSNIITATTTTSTTPAAKTSHTKPCQRATDNEKTQTHINKNNPISPPQPFNFSTIYTADYLATLAPLFLSVALRNETATRILLENGASVNVTDIYGCTPLHLSACVEFQNWECAIALIEFGARIHIRNKHGLSPSNLSPDLINEQRKIIHDILQHIPQNLDDFSFISEPNAKGIGYHLLRKGSEKLKGVIGVGGGLKHGRGSGNKQKRKISVDRVSITEKCSQRSVSISSLRSKFSFNFRFSSSPQPSHTDEFSDMDTTSRNMDIERVSSRKSVLSVVLV